MENDSEILNNFNFSVVLFCDPTHEILYVSRIYLHSVYVLHHVL